MENEKYLDEEVKTNSFLFTKVEIDAGKEIKHKWRFTGILFLLTLCFTMYSVILSVIWKLESLDVIDYNVIVQSMNYFYIIIIFLIVLGFKICSVLDGSKKEIMKLKNVSNA